METGAIVALVALPAFVSFIFLYDRHRRDMGSHELPHLPTDWGAEVARAKGYIEAMKAETELLQERNRAMQEQLHEERRKLEDEKWRRFLRPNE